MSVTLETLTRAFQEMVKVQTNLFKRLGEERAGGGGSRGGEGGSGGGGSDKKKEVLYGKGFEMMDRFSGGEAEWNEWSGDFSSVVQTKSEMAGETLIYIKTVGNAGQT